MSKAGNAIRIVKVHAENFHRLRLAQVEYVPGKGLVRVTGKNRAGKTSFLHAISGALGGAGEVIGEATIHEGAESGEIRIELDNGFTVRRRFTEANPKGYLTVEGPDGGKHAQGKLDEWLGRNAFDPLAFFSLKPDRQADILLGLGEDPDLAEKLADVRDERQRFYDERTPWISQRRRASGYSKPDGERPEPVDTSAEAERLRVLQAQEREREAAQRSVREHARDIERLDNEIADLKRRLAEAEEARDRLQDHYALAEEKLEGAPDPTAEMEQIQSRLSEASAIDRALEPWREWDRAQREVEEAKAEEERLTAAMKECDAREKELVATAGIPVEGLTFDGDGSPLLHGRPLSVASGAERVRMAVSVAMAANPGLRVVLVDEANDIDLEGLEELDRLAKEHDMQVFAVRIGLEGPGEIVIEDGEARDRQEVAA